MNRFKPKKHIAKFNEIKKTLVTFTALELINKFKECKLPANRTFFNAFLKWGTVKKVDNKLFAFNCSKPLHYGELDVIYNSYRSKRNSYKN